MNQQEFIEKYKNKIANGLILVIALLIAGKVYQGQMRIAVTLKQTKNNEIDKNKILDNLKSLDNKFRDYKDFINRKDMASIINIIGELAKESSVEITSVRPMQEEERPLYTRYPYEFKVAAYSYHNIGNFIAKLESHPYIFSVDSALMVPVDRRQEDEADKISVDLRVSTIVLKN